MLNNNLENKNKTEKLMDYQWTKSSEVRRNLLLAGFILLLSISFLIYTIILLK